MNCNLYIAVSEGNVDVLRQHIDQLEIQTTSNSNTTLHVAAQFNKLQCVAEILEVCPSLLRRKNIKGETPLHMAAREGYADIVEALVKCAKKIEQELESGWGEAAKEILRATNVDGDTALHMAVRNCHLEEDEEDKYVEVVRLLTREDPEFQHLANNAKETPLYLAAERGRKGVAVVDNILKTCTSPTFSGPANRTALHAATLNDFTGRSTKRLLEWKKDLIKKADINGWTPLQCAAFNGNEKAIKELLKIDEAGLYDITTNMDGLEPPSSLERRDTQFGTPPLHVAATHGHVNTMRDILSCYPDCWEMVNSKGQNVLHVAMYMEEENVIQFIIRKSWLRHLINQKDNEGNTPLHLLIACDCKVGELWMHHRADQQAFNDKNMTPVDLVWSCFSEERMPTFAEKYIVERILFNSRFTGGRNIVSNAHDNLAKLKRVRKLEKEKRKEGMEMRNADLKQKKNEERKVEMEMRNEAEKRKKERVEDSLKAYQTLVIVAALIATITFAAAFTIPGAYYDGNQGREQGMAILARAAAFKGFLITNTLSVVSSVTSVFLCMTATYYTTFGQISEEDSGPKRYAMASVLILVALVSMMLAFITASFAVLAHSVALAVSTCVIACIPFLFFFPECAKICLSFFRCYVK